jgi:hypothetical protein
LAAEAHRAGLTCPLDDPHGADAPLRPGGALCVALLAQRPSPSFGTLDLKGRRAGVGDLLCPVLALEIAAAIAANVISAQLPDPVN